MGQGNSRHKTTIKVGDQHGGGEQNGTAVDEVTEKADQLQPADTATPRGQAVATETQSVKIELGEAEGGENGEAIEEPDSSQLNGQAHEDANVSTASDASHLKRRKKKGSAKSNQPSTTPSNGTSKLRKRTSFYDTVDTSEVLPYLFIGNLPSAKDEDFLARKNVKYVLNLTSEPCENEVEGLEHMNILLEDEEDVELSPHLKQCYEFINKAKASTTKKHTNAVLVHSYYGISRTSAIVLAYLMKERQWTLKEAYDHLKAKHPSAKPNDGFVIQLLRYDQELHDGKMSMTLRDFYHQL